MWRWLFDSTNFVQSFEFFFIQPEKEVKRNKEGKIYHFLPFIELLFHKKKIKYSKITHIISPQPKKKKKHINKS